MMITVVKNKKKKKEKEKKYTGFARFDPGTVTLYLKTLPRSNKAFSKWPYENFLFIQNWRHHRRKHIQSDLHSKHVQRNL